MPNRANAFRRDIVRAQRLIHDIDRLAFKRVVNAPDWGKISIVLGEIIESVQDAKNDADTAGDLMVTGSIRKRVNALKKFWDSKRVE